MLYPSQCIVSRGTSQFVPVLVTLTLIPSNSVFFVSWFLSAFCVSLLICMGFSPHLLLSRSFCFCYDHSPFSCAGSFGILTSGSVSLLSLVLSGFLFSLLLPPPLILVLCHHSLSKVLKGMQDHLDLPPG